jgi:hypothetical protein
MNPRVDEMVFNEVSGVPGFYQGVLESAAALTFGPAVKVELVASDGTEATYRRIFTG